MVSDVEKLKTHLDLLRDEFVKLQQRYANLEQKYELLNASNESDCDTFTGRISKVIAKLFNCQKYR